jgi:multiple sugar transport system permease protein/putative aldouronate transport system permease protein
MNTAEKTLRARHIRQSKGDNATDVVIYILLFFFFVIVAYPLIYVISASFSSTQAVMSGAVKLWPVSPSVYAYQVIFKNPKIGNGYINSLFYTAAGTGINLVLTILCAFCLSRKDFFGRGFVNTLIIITMFFSGGLIPTYLLVMNLKMLNTFWAMVLPNAMNAWYVILMRTYLQSSIPEELYESAELDGCPVYRMLLAITLPLSGPIIAVIGLYCAVGIWNSYFDAFLYLTKADLQPLQVVLRDILLLTKMDSTMVGDVKDLAMRQGLTNLLKYAVIVVASVPLLLLYPFVQKYFVKGIMIGSLKG